MDEVAAEGEALGVETQRLEERANGLEHDGRLDEQLHRAPLCDRESQLLEDAQLDLGGEERQPDVDAVGIVLRGVRQVLEGARDGTEVDFGCPRSLPDESHKAPLHQPLARHGFPKVRASLCLSRPRTTRGSVDQDAHVQSSMGRSDSEELGVRVDVEEDGVLSDSMPTILSAALLQ